MPTPFSDLISPLLFNVHLNINVQELFHHPKNHQSGKNTYYHVIELKVNSSVHIFIALIIVYY